MISPGFESHQCLAGMWKRWPCWPPRRQQVLHHRWIPGNVQHVHLRKARIKLPTLGFETQRRRHQKSKVGVSLAPQKGPMSCKKIFFKKKKKSFITIIYLPVLRSFLVMNIRTKEVALYHHRIIQQKHCRLISEISNMLVWYSYCILLLWEKFNQDRRAIWK